MPRKKSQPADPSTQIVFRLPVPLYEALRAAADSLGLDVSNLLRMMIAEKVPEYIDRGRRAALALAEARRGAPAAAEADLSQGGPPAAAEAGQDQAGAAATPPQPARRFGRGRREIRV
jgi:hypothetical protein